MTSDQCPNCGISSDTPYRGTKYRCENPDCEKEVFRSSRPSHGTDGATILKVPLVPFASGLLLIAAGAVMAIAVEPSGVIYSILGFAGLAYQRDVQIYGDRR